MTTGLSSLVASIYCWNESDGWQWRAGDPFQSVFTGNLSPFMMRVHGYIVLFPSR